MDYRKVCPLQRRFTNEDNRNRWVISPFGSLWARNYNFNVIFIFGRDLALQTEILGLTCKDQNQIHTSTKFRVVWSWSFFPSQLFKKRVASCKLLQSLEGVEIWGIWFAPITKHCLSELFGAYFMQYDFFFLLENKSTWPFKK